MKQRYTLGILFISFTTLVAAQTETYDILFGSTIGLTMTSGDICTTPFTIEEAHQTTIGNTWGCTWTSIHPGTPSSVQVKLMFSVSDGSGAHPTTLNGTPDNTVSSGPIVNCAVGTMLTWDLNPASYNSMGTNTFLVDFSSSPNNNQLDNLNEGDPYMQVVVIYTPCSPPSIALNASSNVTCFGDMDGSIDLNVTGGTPSYTYDWDIDGTGDFDDTEDLTGLASGTYSVTVMDAVGCSDLFTIDITEPAALDTSVTQLGASLTANETGVFYQWYNCNPWSVLTGQTNALFTATSDGDYAVVVSDGTCEDTSGCYTVYGLGIADDESTSFVQIFPNPASDILSIRFVENDLSGIISIADLNGKIVLQQTFSEQKNNILLLDLDNAESGIYVLQIISESGTQQLKFLKN